MTTSPEAQRDELALELFIADNSGQPRESSLEDWAWFAETGKQRGEVQHYKDMAAGMIAAGYRKPRAITTVAELDALPKGSVVLDGDVCVRRADGRWKVSDLAGVYASAEITLPATVLWEPEA